MAYKKYIKKGGKVYGPYIYHSKRVDGKVVSEYHGPSKLSYKKIVLAVFGLLILVGIVFFAFSEKSPTGFVSLDLSPDSVQGETLSGILNISLERGDFVPSDSKLVFENNGTSHEYNLTGVVPESNFVERTTYPTVYFNVSIELEEVLQNNEGNNFGNESMNGSKNLILNFSSTVSRSRNFEYNLSENMSSEYIVKGEKNYLLKNILVIEESVRTDSGFVENGSSVVNVNVSEGNRIIFSTDYSESVEGLGEGNLEIDLSSFNFSMKEGPLIIKIIHSGGEIVSYETIIGNDGLAEGDSGSVNFEGENKTATEPKIDILPEAGQNETQTEGNGEVVFGLSDEESAVLIENFGNDSVQVKSAVERRGFIILRYELGDFYSEFSYDSNLDNESLNSFIERDRIGWLKDIAKSFLQEDLEESERELEGFN